MEKASTGPTRSFESRSRDQTSTEGDLERTPRWHSYVCSFATAASFKLAHAIESSKTSPSSSELTERRPSSQQASRHNPSADYQRRPVETPSTAIRGAYHSQLSACGAVAGVVLFARAQVTIAGPCHRWPLRRLARRGHRRRGGRVMPARPSPTIRRRRLAHRAPPAPRSGRADDRTSGRSTRSAPTRKCRASRPRTSPRHPVTFGTCWSCTESTAHSGTCWCRWLGRLGQKGWWHKYRDYQADQASHVGLEVAAGLRSRMYAAAAHSRAPADRGVRT